VLKGDKMWLKYTNNLEDDYSFILICVNKLSNLLPDITNKIRYSNDKIYVLGYNKGIVVPHYSRSKKCINMPSLYLIEKTLKYARSYNNYIRYLQKYFGQFNKKLLTYFILLHEYKHSQQSDKLIEQNYYLYKLAKTIDDVRNIPFEKEADDFAFNFIKEHWDFLMSKNN
jgi:hypothetical protein